MVHEAGAVRVLRIPGDVPGAQEVGAAAVIDQREAGLLPSASRPKLVVAERSDRRAVDLDRPGRAVGQAGSSRSVPVDCLSPKCRRRRGPWRWRHRRSDGVVGAGARRCGHRQSAGRRRSPGGVAERGELVAWPASAPVTVYTNARPPLVLAVHEEARAGAQAAPRLKKAVGAGRSAEQRRVSVALIAGWYSPVEVRS